MPLPISISMATVIPPLTSHPINYDFNKGRRNTLKKPKIPRKFSAPRCPSLRKHCVYRRGTLVTDYGEFSMSDYQLELQDLELQRTVENLPVDQLNELFIKVGFPPRATDRLQRALRNTPSVLWLQHKKTGQVIAFANATGDDVFNAIIWDVAVDPNFQGCGLGKVIMERLVADLLAKGIANIAVYAEPNVVGFYGRLGFIADPDGIKFMVYKYLF